MKDKFQELSKEELTKIVRDNALRPFGATGMITFLVFVIASMIAGGVDSYYKNHNSALVSLLAAVCSTVAFFIVPMLLLQMKRLSALIELLRKSNVIE